MIRAPPPGIALLSRKLPAGIDARPLAVPHGWFNGNRINSGPFYL